MKAPRENASVAARHGTWGEDCACAFLRANGYEILDRNARPVPSDRRLEIDVVAYERATDTLVFVEVKQHANHLAGERRIRSVDRGKKLRLRRAFNAWRLRNRWRTGYRFDVIEIFGVPEGGRPELDHVRGVRLFVTDEKFVKWQ